MVTPIEKVYSIRLAVQGENATTPIEIDMTTWANEFPDAFMHIIFRPYNQQHVAPCVTEYDPETHILRWIPTSSITAVVGVGFAEVRAVNTDTGLIKKSRVIPTSIENSVSGEEGIEPPDAYADWVASVMEVKDIAIAAEAARVEAENGRVAAEANREAYEALRSANESSRVNEETNRRYEEMDRADAEQQRLLAEVSRARNESARVNAEQGRVTAEQGRVTAETTRQQYEEQRKSNETTRENRETSRRNAEGDRQHQESLRAQAETIRNTNETNRETAEGEREEGYSTIEQNAQAALSYIGPSESSSTASAAHTKGSYLIYDGKLYQATEDIAIGDTLSTTGTGANIAQVTGGAMGEVADLRSDLKAHADTVDALSLFVNYNDIASFTLTPAAIEIGNATASVTLAWTFYATPASLTLNGVSKSVSSSGETVTATDDGSTHQVTYTLATSIGSKTEAFHFYPNLYWGVSSTAGSPTSAFVIGLASKQLSGSKAKTFTVNAGSGQYIYFCSPVRYGQCSFKSGGFEGGFEAAQTVSVTNASGHTENYYVYRSTNPGLGSTTITVS